MWGGAPWQGGQPWCYVEGEQARQRPWAPLPYPPPAEQQAPWQEQVRVVEVAAPPVRAQVAALMQAPLLGVSA